MLLPEGGGREEGCGQGRVATRNLTSWSAATVAFPNWGWGCTDSPQMALRCSVRFPFTLGTRWRRVPNATHEMQEQKTV